MATLSRRSFVTGGACACALCGFATPSLARIAPSSMRALIDSDYAPKDKDERGLWQQIERIEEELTTSNILIKDPAVNAYVRGVAERVMGAQAGKMRILLMRSPDFNAGMYPTGLMVVNSGALLRFRNEAQLAAVLAHEMGHFFRQHQLRGYRDKKARSAIMSALSVGVGVAGAAFRVDTTDVVHSVNQAIFLGAFAYDRELEAEADAMGLSLIAQAGFAPSEASRVWEQIIGEQVASAKARQKKVNKGYSALATHPASEVRMADLKISAQELSPRAPEGRLGIEDYRSAVAPLLPMLLDDQVKLNNPGASLYLLQSLGKEGADGLLRYHEAEVYRLRGETGDDDRAASALSQAVLLPNAPAEAFRAQGNFLLRKGEAAQGKAMLLRYLELNPTAKDAAMIRFQIQS